MNFRHHRKGYPPILFRPFKNRQRQACWIKVRDPDQQSGYFYTLTESGHGIAGPDNGAR